MPRLEDDLDKEKVRQRKGYLDVDVYFDEISRLREMNDWETAKAFSDKHLSGLNFDTNLQILKIYLTASESPTHPADTKRFNNSVELTDRLAAKRTDDYLSHLYPDYVPDRPERTAPVLWTRLVEQSPPVAGPEAPRVTSQQEPETVQAVTPPAASPSFLENANAVCAKFDRFMDRFVPGIIQSDEARDSFKQNAVGMTVGLAIATGAVLAAAPLSAVFLTGATVALFCANKIEALKKTELQAAKVSNMPQNGA